jgi:hypothetical protein
MGLPDKPKRAFDHVLTNPIIDPVGGTDRSAEVRARPDVLPTCRTCLLDFAFAGMGALPFIAGPPAQKPMAAYGSKRPCRRQEPQWAKG